MRPCARCGYRRVADGAACPECGAAFDESASRSSASLPSAPPAGIAPGDPGAGAGSTLPSTDGSGTPGSSGASIPGRADTGAATDRTPAQGSDTRSRLEAATAAGGLDALPRDFDEDAGDWRTIRADNVFERLFLDPRQFRTITPELVERHAALLLAFWKDKLAQLSQGASKPQMVRKYGDGNEGLVRSYPAVVQMARQALSDRQAIVAAGEAVDRARREAGETKLDPIVGVALRDDRLVPVEADDVLAAAANAGLSHEEARALLLRRLNERGFMPVAVAGPAADADPFSVTWEIPRAAPAAPDVPGVPPVQGVSGVSDAAVSAAKGSRGKWIAVAAILAASAAIGWQWGLRGKPPGARVPRDAGRPAGVPPVRAADPNPPPASAAEPKAEPARVAAPEPARDVPASAAVPMAQRQRSEATPASRADRAVAAVPAAPEENRPSVPEHKSPDAQQPVMPPPVEQMAPVPTPAPAPALAPRPAVDVPTPTIPESAAPAAEAYRGALTGTLVYSGPPVVQNGEIVFRNLPPLRLVLDYDTAIWEARLSPGEGNTQRLVLRNKKPGTQKKCQVTWRAAQQQGDVR